VISVVVKSNLKKKKKEELKEKEQVSTANIRHVTSSPTNLSLFRI